ncbi:MAG: plastocyanin/azurin family copper-binding protein [Gemmatimonadota bacterium]
MKTLITAVALAFALGTPAAFAHEDDARGKAAAGTAAHEPKGHGAELGTPGDPGKVTRTIEIGMSDDMRFTPSRIEVTRGETVKFLVRNHGALAHEMVLGTRKELEAHAARMRAAPGMRHHDPNAVSVAPGGTGTLIWRFTKAGRFAFACLYPGHLEAGMAGAIVVRR